jgi:phage shock protein A
VATIKTKLIELEQRCTTLQEEKDVLSANFDKNKQIVSQLKNSMGNSGVHDQVASLERQIDKADTEQYY